MEYLEKTSSSRIVKLLDELEIPFSGTTLASENKKFHISPFPQITISGIGPVFYINKKNRKIYTLLQRRYKDNFQWWFPGGYVELPFANHGFFKQNFEKIKNATIDEMYKNSSKYGWQKAKKEINDPQFLKKSFKKHKINWPKEIDANWLSAWQREVLEETGVNLEDFPKKIILDFKFNNTLMIGAERDRLTNIDGKFCAFLGELEKEPKTKPDDETEELRWIALDEISFDDKKKNYFSHGKIVNLYTATLIEEALFGVICHQIKQISKIKNPLTKQEISRFNTPQNLQSFLLEKQPAKAWQGYEEISKFLAWEFGELEIGKNLCGKDGKRFYKTSLKICEFLQSHQLSSNSDLNALEKFINK
jgi:8-oxo-dGTP pyrophosphatase MutT (NUDIX family)